MRYFILLSLVFISSLVKAQNTTFKYEVELEAIQIPSLPGIHSYAFAQHDGKWLIIGGRLDGLHARQPFNAFPSGQNNTDIYVIDPEAEYFWSMSLSGLPTGLNEQLQSTNMNFIQDDTTLYIIGGYAYAASASDHITFNNLTSVNVPGLINAVINSTSINSYFKQISDDKFAVTGGQLGKIGNTFYLVGGHRFDGRYNPMGHNTYTQTYTNQIRTFEIDNSGNQLSFSNYNTVTDAQHLHRRDYNLMPQIYPDGSLGYTISSGVFQQNVDLPYLYPVDIKGLSVNPQTSFNQYLSHYHSASVGLYDSLTNEMHMLFFGGMSQYYYDEDVLITDNNVPFVKTISRMSRTSNGDLVEYKLSTEMPGLLGSSAEFILNEDLTRSEHEVVYMHEFQSDTIVLGHIFGGIESTSLNPFSSNNTSQTSADDNIYVVRLIKSEFAGIEDGQLEGKDPYRTLIKPNPFKDKFQIEFELKQKESVSIYITDLNGRLIQDMQLGELESGLNSVNMDLSNAPASQIYYVTVKIGPAYSVVKRLVKE